MHASSLGKLRSIGDPFKAKINKRADRDYMLIGERPMEQRIRFIK